MLSEFNRNGRQIFSGFAFDPNSPHRRFVVEFALDDVPFHLARADEFVPSLVHAACDGCHGFTATVLHETLHGHRWLTATVANMGLTVGQPIDLRKEALQESAVGPGAVQWDGGRTLIGWVKSAPDARIIVAHNGQAISETTPIPWQFEDASLGETRQASFHCVLPEWCADGRFRLFDVTDRRGRALDGSPVGLVAHTDGLKTFLNGTAFPRDLDPRIDLYDRLLPTTLPWSAFAEWQARWLPAAEGDAPIPFMPVVLAKRSPSGPLAEVDAGEIVLPPAAFGREISDVIASARRQKLPEETILVFYHAGTEANAQAIHRLCAPLLLPNTALAYADIVAVQGDGETPFCMPAFSRERFCEQAYAAYFFACRLQHLVRVHRAGGISYLDLFLCDQAIGQDQIVHVPGPLCRVPLGDPHRIERILIQSVKRFEPRSEAAPAQSYGARTTPSVRIKRSGADEITVIIPTRDRIELLQIAVETLLAQHENDLDVRLIIIDNGSTSPDAGAYFHDLRARGHNVLRIDEPFNFAKLNNDAVKRADTEFVCFLNNDTEFVEPVLPELLSRLAAPDVAACGPLLVRETGMVQHGGVVVGAKYGAMHAFEDRMQGNPGYAELLTVAHEVSAVSAACIAVRTSSFLAVGGFDALHFPVAFNDVDLCLKFWARGERVIFTPHVLARHFESISRGSDAAPGKRARAARELANLRSRWGHVLANDPFYNPCLSLGSYPYAGLHGCPPPLTPRAGPAAGTLPQTLPL